MKRILASLSIFMAVACATPESPAQAVYAAQSSYAAALRVELAYSNLPRCNKTKVKLCSEASVIKAVQRADDQAWFALKQAQYAVTTPGFGDSKIATSVASAKALVNTFVAVTQTLKVE